MSVPDDKVYRVESVMQRRKVGGRTEALVKWFGYPSKFNSWFDAKALTPLKRLAARRTARHYVIARHDAADRHRCHRGGGGGGGLYRRVERQYSLASVRHRVSQRGDSISVSGRHLIHGHRDKHLQPNCRSRRF